jgi:hypothetical protein
VAAGERPGHPPKRSGAAVPCPWLQSPVATGEKTVRPEMQFCAAVLDSSRRNLVVSGSCDGSGYYRWRSRRSGAGFGVPQIPFWLTANDFAMNDWLRRQSLFAVVFLS